jgi:hypothetical protein
VDHLLQLTVGQTLKLVGNDPSLGSWRHQDAPSFTWTEDDIWQIAVELPASQPTEFKIVQAAEAHGDLNWCVWQDGENTILDPVALGLQPGQQIEVGCDWDGESRARMVPHPIIALTEPPAAPSDAPGPTSEAPEQLEAALRSPDDAGNKAKPSADAEVQRPWVVAGSDAPAAGPRDAPVIYDPKSETWTFSVVESIAPAKPQDWSAAEREEEDGPSASAPPQVQAAPPATSANGTSVEALSEFVSSAKNNGSGASSAAGHRVHAIVRETQRKGCNRELSRGTYYATTMPHLAARLLGL